MMAQWRKSLEQSSAILQQPLSASSSPSSRRGTSSGGSAIPPLAPITPPAPLSNTRLSTQSPSSITSALPIPVTSSSPLPPTETPLSAQSRTRSQSPPSDSSNIHKTDDLIRPPSSTSGVITTNGGDGSKPQSEDGTTSPPMRLDSKSPVKLSSDTDHLSRSPTLPPPSSHFPPISNSHLEMVTTSRGLYAGSWGSRGEPLFTARMWRYREPMFCRTWANRTVIMV